MLPESGLARSRSAFWNPGQARYLRFFPGVVHVSGTSLITLSASSLGQCLPDRGLFPGNTLQTPWDYITMWCYISGKTPKNAKSSGKWLVVSGKPGSKLEI